MREHCDGRARRLPAPGRDERVQGPPPASGAGDEARPADHRLTRQQEQPILVPGVPTSPDELLGGLGPRPRCRRARRPAAGREPDPWSEQDRLAEDGALIPPQQPARRDHVHLDAQELRHRAAKARLIKERSATVHVDGEVDVRPLGLFASSHRAEHAHVAGMMLRGDLDDLVTTLVEQPTEPDAALGPRRSAGGLGRPRCAQHPLERRDVRDLVACLVRGDRGLGRAGALGELGLSETGRPPVPP